MPSAFSMGPYLMLGAPGVAYVSLKATLKTPPTVRWWREPIDDTEPVVTEVVAVAHEDLWVATLKGLPVGPRLRYAVHSEVGDTDDYGFRVGMKRGQSFRFGAFGDTRTGHDVHRAVVEALARERLEFVLHSGDMVETGGVKGQWARFFQIERPLLLDTPIVPSVGNHDVGHRGYYRRYFLHDLWAEDRRYFTFDWGHLRVVSVDVNMECRDGCMQHAYVERALSEGAKRGMLMVIMLHYPPFSSGAHGSNMRVKPIVTTWAERYGVELVIAGHDHNYERTKPQKGTTYVVSGSAGAPIRPVHPKPFTAHARTEPHYVLVDVERDRLVMRAVNLQGDVFDQATIPALAPAPAEGP